MTKLHLVLRGKLTEKMLEGTLSIIDDTSQSYEKMSERTVAGVYEEISVGT